ncbi:hypothetical protein F6455_12930 [Proteobacteria bacterium 005FR1]|nr:hypothetical protein [Proteobacteria bacterium 005FR1]
MMRCLLCLSILFAAGSAQAQMPDDVQHRLFETSDKCLACHNGLISPQGEDVSIGLDWQGSMMANSARDPYWHAAVRREVMDHPESQGAIEDECAACHMPMARYQSKAAGDKGQIFTHLPFSPRAPHQSLLAEDGVSCAMCHQITDKELGSPQSFTGNFHVNTEQLTGERSMFGPFEIESGHQEIMRSATGFIPQQGKHLQSSELCASCHTLYTHALKNGEVVGELPEQVPYLEWRHSAFANEQSCQDCHMPIVQEKTRVTSVLGEAREGLNRHTFRGGNFFMLGMLNRYADELAVEAPPQAMQAAIDRTLDYLQNSTARLQVSAVRGADGALDVTVNIENLAGHKLPSAYPSRRVWLHLQVRDRQGELLFESGRFNPDGSIVGNDNDKSPERFEPHYELIDSPDQVQIFEAIMADSDDQVTTGLLSAVRFTKDNRLLPRGFMKSTAATDIAVKGKAANDVNFSGGGDQVRYRIDSGNASGPYQIDVQLWYQPIAYRWAMNLADYNSEETNRFVRMYRSMSADSAVVLAQNRTTTKSEQQ